MGTRATALAPLALCALCFSLPAQAQGDGAPLSAIDWLSNSVDLPAPAPETAPKAPDAAPEREIVVAPLDGPVPDRAGLLPARALGLTPSLWGNSPAEDLSRMITALPDAQTPALKRFIRDLLVAQFDPPVDALLDDSLYLARIDKLLDLGHLDDAMALIEAGGAPEPRRFRRQFDIALLTERETRSCAVMEATPDISPTIPARIFCLARNGDWDVAALTLGNAASLGLLEEDEEELLLHFLDPDLFEGEPLPTPPFAPTPLEFRLYEAVGERIATDALPVAFAFADLTETVGWKARLRATERLAAAGAISAVTLKRIYTERAPAASGGIWERVRAVQALFDALETKDTDAIERALPPAWAAAQNAGFEATLAQFVVRRLEGVDLSGAAAHIGFEVALLTGRVDMAEGFAASTPEDRFLVAVATGEIASVPASDVLEQAVRRGLTATAGEDRFTPYMESGRAGEALLQAIGLIAEGSAGDPDAVADALTLLRRLGLEALARQTAVELLLQEGAA